MPAGLLLGMDILRHSTSAPSICLLHSRLGCWPKEVPQSSQFILFGRLHPSGCSSHGQQRLACPRIVLAHLPLLRTQTACTAARSWARSALWCRWACQMAAGDNSSGWRWRKRHGPHSRLLGDIAGPAGIAHAHAHAHAIARSWPFLCVFKRRLQSSRAALRM
jgi:hypothetical protein